MTTILILGGTGKTGRRIAQRLRSAGHRVRTAARKDADIEFDLDRPASWAPALADVSAVYLVEPSIQTTPEGKQRIPNFVGAARAAGARRIVMLSAPGAEFESHPLHPAERATRDSGAEWTILRPGWFAQNFSEDFWRPAILGGEIALPTGEGRTAFIDADDIADVATAALTRAGHAGETYTLTGPEAITFGAAVDLISEAIGREIKFVDASPEDYVEQQVAAGAPRAGAQQLAAILVRIREGQDGVVADGVQRALGRPARTFDEFVVAAAPTGCWN